MVIRSLSFNQSGSHLVVSTDSGFLVYKLNPEIERMQSTTIAHGVGIMKMLHKTNMSVITGGGQPDNIVMLWDDINRKSVISIDVKKRVQNLAIINDKIIVVLEKSVCVFNFSGKLFHCRRTYTNPNGLCVVSDDETNPLIATLGTEKGQVVLWKPNHDKYVEIQAHNDTHHIQSICMNRDNSLIATASDCGTLINVFDTESAQLVHKFRRGMDSAKILDLAFSVDSKFLACGCGKGTIHIFSLDKDMNTTSMLAGWVPLDYFNSEWSFQKHYLPYYPEKMVLCFDDNNILHVGTTEGKYYRIYGSMYDRIKCDDLQSNLVE
jgi:autophagy-related protein 18